MSTRKIPKTGKAMGLHPGFALVVDILAVDDQVSYGDGEGFGSRSLKVNGKIFAMMCSKGRFVVKLPKEKG